MTLREFLRKHNSLDLAEIEARDRIDPLDHVHRLELALAKIASLSFNAHRDPNKSEALPTADFLPQWGQKYRDQAEIEAMLQDAPKSVDELRAKLAAAFRRG